MLPLIFLFFVHMSSALWFEAQRVDHFDLRNSRKWGQEFRVEEACFDPNKTNAHIRITFSYGLTARARSKRSCDSNALRFELVHRFYGRSQPTGDLSLESLKFLSSKQALADQALFIQQYIRAEKKWDGIPIIAVGCSYPGALAIWSRIKYPHLIQGAVGLSPVIKAVFNFSIFHDISREALEKYYNPLTEGLRSVWNNLTNWAMEDNRNETFRSLNLCPDPNISLFDLAEGIKRHTTYVFSEDLVQYWNTHKLDEAQTLFQADPFLAMQELILNNHGNSICSPAWKWTQKWNFPQLLLKDLRCAALPCEVYRMWWWQKCSEFGWFKPVKNDLFSYFSMEEYLEICEKAFLLSESQVRAGIDGTNFHYGGTNVQTKNVLIINGEVDGWRAASIDANVTNNRFQSMVLENEGHCPEDPSIEKSIHKWVSEYGA